MHSWPGFLRAALLLVLAGTTEHEQLILDLKSVEPARREVAAKRLIALGDPAAELVRPYLTHPDPVLATYARRIFAATRGVSAELEAQVRSLIENAGERGVPATVEDPRP